MIKIIVAGSRSFNDYDILRRELDSYLIEKNIKEEIEIVSGGAVGADQLGERYAIERKLKIKKFPAEWGRYGKSAGFIRNKQMAFYATHCVCFWDGESKGTKMMINIAREHGLKPEIIKI